MTMFIDAVIAETKKIPLAESGAPVVLPPFYEEVTLARKFLEQHPEGGILYIGATSGLDQEMLRSLLKERAIDARHFALFGVHAWTPADGLLRVQRVQSYGMTEISREGLTEMTDAVMSFARQWPAFHLIINLDALDSAFVPGLENSKGGGFTTRELIYVVQRLRLIRTCVSVEVVGAGQPDALTIRTAAKLLAECTSNV
jgi:arginase family enzyme